MGQVSFARRNASSLRMGMGLLLTSALLGCSRSSDNQNVAGSRADAAYVSLDASGPRRVDAGIVPADTSASPPADAGALAGDAGIPPGDAEAGSAGEGLPPASMVTGLRFVPVINGGPNPAPPVRVVVTDVSRAQDVYSATVGLPEGHQQGFGRLDWGITYLLAFSFSDGSELPVTLDPSGWQLVQIPGSSERTLLGSGYDYWNRLADDLGIPEATIVPYVPPAFQSNPDPQQEGVACKTDADCDADDRCGYLVGDGCAATGVCMVSACTGPNCAAGVPEICGCEGQPIQPVWSQSSATSVVPVYTSAPASGWFGPCPGSGQPGGTRIGPGRDGSGACDPGCQASFFAWCVAASWSKCVDCYADADCAANPRANGPTCDTATNYCERFSDSDCKHNLWGHVCDTSNGVCACTSDSDCGPDTSGPSCNQGMCSCASDTDCSGNNLGAKCTGLSCSCGSDSDCPPSRSCTGALGLGTWKYCQ